VAALEQQWTELVPQRPFDYFYLDEAFDQQYRNDEISHLILLKSNGANLYAYVELYNSVCAVVVLSNDYKGAQLNQLSSKTLFLAKYIIVR
jgi:hypothetical protein